MTTQQKLQSLIVRIEHSHLPEAEKNALYETISQGLHAAVLPTLVPFMPQEKLDALATMKPAVSVEGYYDMINTTVASQEAMEALDQVLLSLLDAVDDVLKQKFI